MEVTAAAPLTVREVYTWHSVLLKTDDTASEAATIDLACMLVNYTLPKIVVEAGTYRGHMALALANVFRQMSPESRIYTADTIGTGFELALDNELKELAPWIHFHHGDFLEMLKDVPDPIDFAYIDASSKDDSHMRMNHATAVYERLSVGGLILVDDTSSPDWGDAVRFRDWAQMGGLHLSRLRGLTIIQKPDSHA